MILIEKIDNRVRRYSSLGYKLRQLSTNNLYDEALDYIPCRYQYEETDIPIGDGSVLEPQEALDIILGGGSNG